jgi:hypothetical protein
MAKIQIMQVMDSWSRMTTDLSEPVASLEEIQGSAVFPPSYPSSRAFRHEQLEIFERNPNNRAAALSLVPASV